MPADLNATVSASTKFSGQKSDGHAAKRLNLFEGLYRDTMKMKKRELEGLRKSNEELNAEYLATKKLLVQRSASYKIIQERCNSLKKENEEVKAAQYQLKVKYRALQTLLEKNEAKFCQMEIVYDDNIHLIKSEKHQLEKKLNETEKKLSAIVAEFKAESAAHRNKALEDKMQADCYKQQNENIKSELEEKEVRCKELVEQLSSVRAEHEKDVMDHKMNTAELMKQHKLEIDKLQASLEHMESLYTGTKKELEEMNRKISAVEAENKERLATYEAQEANYKHIIDSQEIQMREIKLLAARNTSVVSPKIRCQPQAKAIAEDVSSHAKTAVVTARPYRNKPRRTPLAGFNPSSTSTGDIMSVESSSSDEWRPEETLIRPQKPRIRKRQQKTTVNVRENAHSPDLFDIVKRIKN